MLTRLWWGAVLLALLGLLVLAWPYAPAYLRIGMLYEARADESRALGDEWAR